MLEKIWLYTQHFKKLKFDKLTDFLFENYYKRIVFVKEKSYYFQSKLRKKKTFLLLVTKLMQKLANPNNAKEQYNSYLNRKK